MVVQDLVHCTLLHDKELVYFFFGELLLGVDVKPVPNCVPEVTLVDVLLVQHLEQNPALLQVVDVLGHELPHDIQTVTVDARHLGQDLILGDELVVIKCPHILLVFVEPDDQPEELVVILVELLHEDVIDQLQPDLVVVDVHGGHAAHEGA